MHIKKGRHFINWFKRTPILNDLRNFIPYTCNEKLIKTFLFSNMLKYLKFYVNSTCSKSSVLHVFKHFLINVI